MKIAAKAAPPSAGKLAPTGPTRCMPCCPRLGIRQVGLVPDAGHSRLIQLCEADKNMRIVRLTTEEEGVGLLAGAWLER